IPVSTANDLVDVSEKTNIQRFGHFRDICTNNFENNSYRIGGPGVIVEIDESLVTKRKNNVGHVVEQRHDAKPVQQASIPIIFQPLPQTVAFVGQKKIDC
ncbi:hypothetical protein PoB_003270200, partial [Plakobranchus ocellatus]